MTPLEQQTRRFMGSVQRAESAAAKDDPSWATKEACQALRDMAALIAPMLDHMGVLTQKVKDLEENSIRLEKALKGAYATLTDLEAEHRRYGPPRQPVDFGAVTMGLSPELREALEARLKSIDLEPAQDYDSKPETPD